MDDDGTHYGFVALSIGVLSEKPCLVIDYLFVSQIYRGEVYGELGDITIGKFLLSYAFSLAQEANVNYPIRYIALEPANAKLEIYYLSAGFSKLDATRFMFLKLGSWPNE
jgi:GNAT superfamily N-acetyltransferase